jgi:Domain of Unknown Function (DUF928)
MLATNKYINAAFGVVVLTLFQTVDLLDVWRKGISLSQTQVLANEFPLYVPPPNRRPIVRTDGSASRGCPNGLFGSINLLVPSDHIGLTVSAHPTFTWYVSAAPSTLMQFALVEPGASKPILIKQLKVSKPGIIQLDLPEQTPLSVGKEYRWTVSLICNQKRPSQNIYVRSRIQRVSVKALEIPELRDNPVAHNLAQSATVRDRAKLYGQSGIWYDAVSAISKTYLLNPQDPLNAKYLRLLLDQVGLTGIANSQLLLTAQKSASRSPM